jgi:glycosyltransferase involved in cell wall biosynthesis
MEQHVRILVIDNLAVESLRREVYRVLATEFRCEVHLLVPNAWQETRGQVECEPEEGHTIHLHRSRILFGFRHQRVLYLDLVRVIRDVRPHFILAAAQPESYAAAQVCLVRRVLARGTGLGLFSSRNIDYPKEGFPYRAKCTHSLCDRITRASSPDICFYRPRVAGDLLAPYARRLIYVPHVVDCSLFRKRQTESPSAEKDTVIIGYAGRLVREKGLFVLLDAMRQLPAHVRLVLVGSGPEEQRLRKLAAENGHSDRVEFHPPVPYGDMPSTLGKMDLLVLPSLETKYWKELFGRILIEAMASEVPVVASDSGGIPGVLGDAGLLVPSGDTRALGSALDHLCRDTTARRDLGRKGRERALRNFDVPVVARILGNAVMNVVASTVTEGSG